MTMTETTGDFTVVATPAGQAPYALLGPNGEPVEPVQDYLAELLAADCSPLTLRSYAFDLLAWFRFLAAAGVGWQAATRADVRDWVLRLRGNPTSQRGRGGGDRVSPGRRDPCTSKTLRREGYAPATINHRLSVVAGFYQHHARLGNGPTVNPVPDDGPCGSRRNTHHNPMQPWTPGPRGSYRQKTEQRLPRAIPDQLYEQVFAALTSNRDRAMINFSHASPAASRAEGRVHPMNMLPPSHATLLLRTDFSDQKAWEALRTAIGSPTEEGFMATAEVLDDRAYQDLTTEQILGLVPEDHQHRLLAVADKTTMSSSEMPLLVIDLFEEPRGEIRVIASEFWSIENNLSLANMDFDEFAGAVDEDGIFRGF